VKGGGRLRAILSIAISAGLLAYLYREYFPEARDLDINWSLLAAGASLSLAINYGFGAYKWNLVLRQHGIQLARWDMIRIWIGIFSLGFVFPFHTGHLLFVRAVEKCGGAPFGLSLRAMVFDKGLNVLAALVLVAGGQLLLPAESALSHPLILAAALLPLFVFVFLDLDDVAARLPASWERPRAWLEGMNIEISVLQKVKLLGISTIYQGTDVISAVFAGLAILPGCDVLGLAGAFPLVMLVSYVPAAFQGLGTREALSVLWLTGSFSEAEAATLGFLVSMVDYALPAAAGVGCVAFTVRAVSTRLDR
jgi:hypothetical protein